MIKVYNRFKERFDAILKLYYDCKYRNSKDERPSADAPTSEGTIGIGLFAVGRA